MTTPSAVLDQEAPLAALSCAKCGAPAQLEECPVWSPGRPPFVRVIARCSKWRGHATVLEERDQAPTPEPPTTEETMSTTFAVRPCADCGADLTGRHHKARYCLACRRAHDEDTARRKSDERRRQASRPAIIACETCGVDVLVADSGPVPRYCPDCRGSRKAEPCPEPAPLGGPEAETELEAETEFQGEAEAELQADPGAVLSEQPGADDSPTLPDMAVQLLEWMPHLLALSEEDADLVFRLARAEARRSARL